MNTQKPNCFEKNRSGRGIFIFHQITDELSTKHETRLRTTLAVAEVRD
jgi:anti-sigma regulatory factor (Ser/Thr protein kinase)